jgi:DNA-binding MarR family transcriptional regulator
VTTGTVSPDEAGYRDAAALREALRRFHRSSEQVAVANGLTPQRQLLLLLIRGAPGGSGRATDTDLAERMQLAQNTVTDLVRRAEEAGLVAREPSPVDGRVTYLALTDEGERRLAGTVGALQDERARLIELVRGLNRGD